MLRFYFEVARTAYRRQLIYRWANLAGLLTNTFWGIILSSVIIALYHARPAVSGYNLRDALSYTWFMQGVTMLGLTFGWTDLMQTIRTGEVITDLNKPCDFFLYWFSRELGRSVYYMIFRCLPTYLLGTLIFGLPLGAGWSAWLALPVFLGLGAMSGIAFRVLLNLAAFWLLEARAVISLGINLALFFTGSYIPVIFFPTWLAGLAVWLPFNGMQNVPAQVFLGKLSGQPLLFELALQLAWLLILLIVVRLTTAVATRRVVVQGG